MSLYIHKISTERHEKLLQEQRKDTVTKDPIKAGDQVVFCAGCGSVFQMQSWDFVGRKHCGQSDTLDFVPEVKAAHFQHDPERILETPLLLDTTALQRIERNRRLSRFTFFLSLMTLLFLGVYLFRTIDQPSGKFNAKLLTEDYNESWTEDRFPDEHLKMKNASILWKQGHFHESYQTYVEIIDINANFTPAIKKKHEIEQAVDKLLAEAESYRKQKRYDMAMANIERALEIMPDSESVQAEEMTLYKETSKLPFRYVKLLSAQFREFEIDSERYEFGMYKGKLLFQNMMRPDYLRDELLFQLDLSAAGFSQSGRTEVRCFTDGRMDVYDHALNGRHSRSFRSKAALKSLAFNPKGKHVAAVCDKNQVHIWDIERGEKVKELQAGEMKSLAWMTDLGAPGVHHLAVSGPDNNVYTYVFSGYGKLKTSNFKVFELKKNEQAVIAPNGKYFAVLNPDLNFIRLCSLQDGKILKSFSLPDFEKPQSLVFSSDSRFLTASTPGQKSIAIWKL